MSAVQTILAGASSYLIGVSSIPAPDEGATIIRDFPSAQSVISRCVGDHFSMKLLRELVTDFQRAEYVQRMNDVEVVELVAGLVSGSRLCLLDTTPPPPGHHGFATVGKASPAASAAAAPASRSAPQAVRSAPSETAEPSFIADLDAALMAATLRDASQDGTPFCEECARAARAA